MSGAKNLGQSPSASAPLMLGVSGCRGIVGGSLTPELAARYAGAFGGWLHRLRSQEGPATVVLSRDGRAGGEMVRYAALSGLIGAGCRVIDLGVAMTPTVGVMVDALSADGGMVLTASHNPQDWNGLKCIVRDAGTDAVSAAAPSAAQAAQIIEAFHAGQVGQAPWNRIGSVTHDHDAAERHVEKVLGALGQIAYIGDIRRCRFRVAVDSLNASGRVGAASLLDELGCEVAHLGDQTSGIFPHTPEPLRENLEELAMVVREHGADVGFAQDPDADRLAIIDERGKYIGEEYTLVLASLAVLGAQRGGVATGAAKPVVAVNLSTSRMIDDLVQSKGGSVARAMVGEANVVETMRKLRSPIGGEGNGGVIWPAVTYIRDSLSSMALTLALLAGAVHGKRLRLSELIAQMPAYAIEKRKVDLASKDLAKPAVEAIARAYSSDKIDRQDGVRVDFESKRAWLHVRASNTEPIMRLIAEAPTAEAAKAILDDATKVIAKG